MLTAGRIGLRVLSFFLWGPRNFRGAKRDPPIAGGSVVSIPGFYVLVYDGLLRRRCFAFGHVPSGLAGYEKPVKEDEHDVNRFHGRSPFPMGTPAKKIRQKNDALRHVPSLSARLSADHPLRDYQTMPCGMSGEV